jgi:ATP-dependent helicase HepA
MTSFQPGQMVALKSDPNKLFPVIEILPASQSETRYKVFVDNAPAIYYQSQLISIDISSQRKPLTAKALKAHITALQLQTPSRSHLYSLNSGRIQFVPYQYRRVIWLNIDNQHKTAL